MRVLPDIPHRIEWNRIIIVGEAPGQQEARKGKPFVGPSGRLLNRQLRAARINRKASIIINPFDIQPPGNQVDYFFQQPPYGQVKPQFREAIRRFHRVLHSYQPAVILALGKTAAWAVTNYRGTLGERIGQVQATDYGIVIFAWHPSYLLRTPDTSPQQIKIFKLARLLARRMVH